MAELALFGVVQCGLGLILFTIDARLITALQVSLLNRLQTALGPVWVWLAFGKVPQLTTLVGGSLVLISAMAATPVTLRTKASAGANI